MRNNFLLIFICLVFKFNGVLAQQTLVFEDITNNKFSEIATSDLVKFEYRGYLGQSESIYGTVISIDDSLVTVISLEKFRKATLGIHVKHITGFRRFKKSRLILEPLVSTTLAVSSIFLFYWLEKNRPNVGFGTRLGISIGASLISTGVSKIIFNKKVRQHTAYGWQMSLR